MKIALLFLTSKDLHHPVLWEEAIREAPDCFNIYIHSKERLENLFFQPFRIHKNIATTYLNHVQAWQVLISTAVSEPENTKFILLSESCIPLYPLKEIHKHLLKDSYSYMSYRRPWWDSDLQREVIGLPVEDRWGNAEWVILNRKHAKIVAQDSIVINTVAQYPYDSESYFSTLFHTHGILHEIICKQTTYAKFTDSDGTHAYTFRAPNAENTQSIYRAKRAGCLFARKFSSEFPGQILESIQHLFLRPQLNVTSIPSELVSQEYQAELSLANTALILSLLIHDLNLKVGCEIGVSSGLHMERILQETSIEELYGIDPYEGQDLLYSFFRERMDSMFSDRAMLVRKTASVVVKELPKYSLDYLFFHEEYSFEPIEDLLEIWFDKVKGGGIICGWHLDEDKVDIPVSIKQFFSRKNLDVHMDSIEVGFWWVNIMYKKF